MELRPPKKSHPIPSVDSTKTSTTFVLVLGVSASSLKLRPATSIPSRTIPRLRRDSETSCCRITSDWHPRLSHDVASRLYNSHIALRLFNTLIALRLNCGARAFNSLGHTQRESSILQHNGERGYQPSETSAFVDVHVNDFVSVGSRHTARLFDRCGSCQAASPVFAARVEPRPPAKTKPLKTQTGAVPNRGHPSVDNCAKPGPSICW
jgi:hypothetical protein